jgi:hypothetical protein
MIVIAMMTAAITQPAAIQRPPNTIQARFSRKERGDIDGSMPQRRIGGASGPMSPPAVFKILGVSLAVCAEITPFQPAQPDRARQPGDPALDLVRVRAIRRQPGRIAAR